MKICLKGRRLQSSEIIQRILAYMTKWLFETNKDRIWKCCQQSCFCIQSTFCFLNTSYHVLPWDFQVITYVHFQIAAHLQRGWFKRRETKASICTDNCVASTVSWVSWVPQASRIHTATNRRCSKSRAWRSCLKINSSHPTEAFQMNPPTKRMKVTL